MDLWISGVRIFSKELNPTGLLVGVGGGGLIDSGGLIEEIRYFDNETAFRFCHKVFLEHTEEHTVQSKLYTPHLYISFSSADNRKIIFSIAQNEP